MPQPRLLDRIVTPHQLRRLSEDQLVQVADELRQRIIEVVSSNGGHLASNLGITELTVALHNVFDFSHDRLLWDVGHQCYAHKLLTGRGERFSTLRQAGGISGFPAPSESPYDLFATGHAGTAISTAAGMAWADHVAARDTRVVAVVGDGSIVNGLSLEGLNNAAMLKRQFLIVLNDNSMSIDPSQGALAGMLDRVRTSHTYSDIKQSTETMLQRLPLGEEISEAIRQIKAGLRTTLHGGSFFESLGIAYFGPVDGHNIHALVHILGRLAAVNQPVILHVHTQKGRGCQYAVEDPCRFHSPPAYRIEEGKAVFAKTENPSWTAAFSKVLVDLAATDERIMAITAAMPDGTGLSEFRAAYPSRFVDVGISESHAVAMAAGLSRAGLRPVVAIYSTFMQRAVDQVFQELALQKLPALLCMDRAGLVGSDGAVHQGFMDISMFRCVPGMVLMAPGDAEELRSAMTFAMTLDVPAAIRYPRDEIPQPLSGPCPPFELGKSRRVREGDDATLFAYGAMVEQALEAADELAIDGIEAAVYSARFAKPLDAAALATLVAAGKPMLVVEDHAIAGGLGSAVLELAAQKGLDASNVRLAGLPDRFVSHASRSEQLARVGLDGPRLAATIREMLKKNASSKLES